MGKMLALGGAGLLGGALLGDIIHNHDERERDQGFMAGGDQQAQYDNNRGFESGGSGGGDFQDAFADQDLGNFGGGGGFDGGGYDGGDFDGGDLQDAFAVQDSGNF